MPTPTYRKWRNQLKTGDIVLFSGKAGISRLIKWYTVSPWSHVGMVIKEPSYDSVLIWESLSKSSLPDVQSGLIQPGVQLLALSERIKHYKGQVALRQIAPELSQVQQDKLKQLRQELSGRPYEQSTLALIQAGSNRLFGKNEENLESLFCSELIAEAYQCIDFLPESLASNKYSPKDFSSHAKLPFLGEVTLGREIILKS